MQDRRKTRKVAIGDDRVGRKFIGGDAPILVQTMTNQYYYPELSQQG
jgi:4-hydroxy-3-methylbut-2-en-1-yl diphosphate synthase IspG/GcpE